MTRKTSAEAYAKVQGVLGNIQWEVYKILYEFGPLTAREVASKLPLYQIDSIRNRFAEMEEMGVIATVGERECSVTGNNAMLWDVTDLAVPRPLKPKPSAKLTRAGLEKELEEAQERIRELTEIANDCVKALEANNPDMLPYARFEVRAEGKPGLTLKSEAKISSPDAVGTYCDRYGVKPGELIFTKYRAGVDFKPLCRTG